MRVEFHLKTPDVTGKFEYTTVLLCAKRMSFVPSIGMEISGLRHGDPLFKVSHAGIDFYSNFGKVLVERVS